MVKRTVAIITGVVLLAAAGLLCVIFPESPEVYTTFPEVLSAEKGRTGPAAPTALFCSSGEWIRRPM